MLKLNLSCRRLPVSRWPGGLIQPQMPGLTFMHGVFSVDRVPHSLTYGCATQMRNLTKTSPLSKFITNMKTRRNVSTQAELWRWNKPRAHRWCLPLQVAWHLSLSQATSGTTCHLRKARISRLRCL